MCLFRRLRIDGIRIFLSPSPCDKPLRCWGSLFLSCKRSLERRVSTGWRHTRLTGLAGSWESYTLLQYSQTIDTSVDNSLSLAKKKKKMYILEAEKVRKPATSPAELADTGCLFSSSLHCK